jgi:hypothetical protein
MKYPEAIAGRMDVDHIDPVIAIEESGKRKDWNKVITRLFCSEENVQCICWICHKSKTLAERSERGKAKKIEKDDGVL